MYTRHLTEYDPTDAETRPNMDPKDTQIPNLCDAIYRIPSQGKMNVLQHFARHILPSHLDVVAMSCAKTTEARVIIS